MMKYARRKLPKKAYGGGIDYSKYLTDNSGKVTGNNQSTSTSGTDSTTNAAMGAADMVGNTFGGSWYGSAMGLQQSVRAAVPKRTYMNKDGTTTTVNDNEAGDIVDATAKPLHETVITAAGKGDWGSVAGNILLTPGGWNLATGALGKATNQRDELEAERVKNEQQQMYDVIDKARKAKYEEQMNYSKGYNLVNPVTGREGAGIYAANGGRMAVPFSMKANRGKLIPLSSDGVKVDGLTHSQGGVDIKGKNGQPVAEVEDDEVLVGDMVFSKKLGFAGTVEPLVKEKGKLEGELKNANDFRTKNTISRNIQKIDGDIKSVYNQQTEFKQANGLANDNDNEEQETKYASLGGKLPKYRFGNSPTFSRGTLTDAELADEEAYAKRGNNNSGFTWNTLGKGLEGAVPYIDNIYNNGLINQIPDIPKPVNNVAYDAKVMPMKTNININPALNNSLAELRMFNKDINNNVANSATGRGNKLAAFSRYLGNSNELYGNKENAETDLINKSNANTQAVINANIGNRQNIDNSNIAQENNYRYAKMGRINDILHAKGSNVANAVNDATMQIRDRNIRTNDTEKSIYYNLGQNNAAGLATLMDTPEMDKMASNPQYAQKIYETLKQGGEVEAASRFKAKYRTKD